MRRKQIYLFLLFVFLIVVSISTIEVNAMHTGFEITELPSEEKELFISNINILSIDEEPAKKTIKCFDVNGDQLIAIGQNTSNRKTICVYSNKGVFQYGYTFNCTGDFGVEWDEEKLNIYFVRSSVIVSVSPKGEVLGAFEVENTIDNNSYINHFFHTRYLHKKRLYKSLVISISFLLHFDSQNHNSKKFHKYSSIPKTKIKQYPANQYLIYPNQYQKYQIKQYFPFL